VLVARFVRTGGIPMLRMMGGSPDADTHDDSDHADHELHEHHSTERGTRRQGNRDHDQHSP